jgi:hypothetical protein
LSASVTRYELIKGKEVGSSELNEFAILLCFFSRNKGTGYFTARNCGEQTVRL